MTFFSSKDIRGIARLAHEHYSDDGIQNAHGKDIIKNKHGFVSMAKWQINERWLNFTTFHKLCWPCWKEASSITPCEIDIKRPTTPGLKFQYHTLQRRRSIIDVSLRVFVCDRRRGQRHQGDLLITKINDQAFFFLLVYWLHVGHDITGIISGQGYFRS